MPGFQIRVIWPGFGSDPREETGYGSDRQEKIGPKPCQSVSVSVSGSTPRKTIQIRPSKALPHPSFSISRPDPDPTFFKIRISIRDPAYRNHKHDQWLFRNNNNFFLPKTIYSFFKHQLRIFFKVFSSYCLDLGEICWSCWSHFSKLYYQQLV